MKDTFNFHVYLLVIEFLLFLLVLQKVRCIVPKAGEKDQILLLKHEKKEDHLIKTYGYYECK